MKILGSGILFCLLTSLISFFIGGWGLTLKIDFGIGLILLIIAMIFSGSLASGDQMRANFHTESKEDRVQRMKWTDKVILISVPFLVISIIIYFIYE